MSVKALATRMNGAASPSERRRRVDPEDASGLLPDVAVMMRKLGAEDEAVAGRKPVTRRVDDELDLAGQHVADLLAGMLDWAGALAVQGDVVDVALEHVSGRVGDDALQADALAAAQRVERDLGPRALAEDDALVAVHL